MGEPAALVLSSPPVTEESQLRGTRFLVSGRVQGVGFRAFVRRRARELGLVGWVKNLPDGRVEVEAVGPGAALAELEQVLRQGPPASRVTSVEPRPLSGPGDYDDFDVLF